MQFMQQMLARNVIELVPSKDSKELKESKEATIYENASYCFSDAHASRELSYDELFAIFYSLCDPISGLKQSDKRSFLKRFRNCFQGAALVRWLESSLHLGRAASISIATQLLEASLIRSTNQEKTTFEETALYSMLCNVRALLKGDVEVLDLEGCSLERVPIDLSRMSSIRELYLASNHLYNLPAISELRQLEILDISENSITQLDLGALKKLSVFRARHNKIYLIADNLEGHSELEEMYLSHNQLASIPHSIGNLLSTSL